MVKVFITIPAYNEETTLGSVLQGIKKELAKKYDFKLLVVDDGSTDKTAEVARNEGAIVVCHPRNCGLAQTFGTEMSACLQHGADIIVHTDADGQYLASDIPKLIEAIKKGNDLVLGSRFLGKIEKMPFVKKLGNRAFSRVVSQITRQKITDAQTGFRAFTREVAALPITSTFTYTQEQIIRAARAKFRITEIPIYFAQRGGDGKSRLMKNPFDFAAKAGVNLLRIYRDYEPLKFFSVIGGLFILISFVLDVIILQSYFTTGYVGGIPRVILAAMLFLTGVQIMLFGFLADMMRK